MQQGKVSCVVQINSAEHKVYSHSANKGNITGIVECCVVCFMNDVKIAIYYDCKQLSCRSCVPPVVAECLLVITAAHSSRHWRKPRHTMYTVDKSSQHEISRTCNEPLHAISDFGIVVINSQGCSFRRIFLLFLNCLSGTRAQPANIFLNKYLCIYHWCPMNISSCKWW